MKVSGTAYDQAWQYSKDNRFVYSYWDEQLYYKGQYPKMNVHTIAVDVNGYREIFGNDPDAFTNIFHTNEDGTEFIKMTIVAEDGTTTVIEIPIGSGNFGQDPDNG